MQGACLCKAVRFEIDGNHYKIYQCHCSLCRKQGGSSSNTATIVPNQRFRWLGGREKISSWTKDTGFRSDFCQVCGSPVPNPLAKLPYYWVPLGLIEDHVEMDVVAHLCNSSRARWDAYDPGNATIYEQLPNHIVDFIESLQGHAQ
jgi:hypothetical protein